MRPYHRNRYNSQEKRLAADEGFTLIGLALLLVIASLALTSFLYLNKIEQQQKEKKAKAVLIETITDAISKHFMTYGYYPCPARIDLADGDPDYGKATDCNDGRPTGCANGICVEEGTATRRVRIGAIPFRDILVGKEDILDTYNNRWTYAVTEDQAKSEPDYTLGEGGIIMRYHNYNSAGVDTGITETTNLDVIFLSHGANGVGAYTSGGVIGMPCAGPADSEQENCDGDATFVMTRNPTARVENAIRANLDDFVVDNIWKYIYIWGESDVTAENVYNRRQNMVGINTGTPTQKMHIQDGNLLIENGQMEVPWICNQSGSSCFRPANLGGNAASPKGGGMRCQATRFMVQMRRHDGGNSNLVPANPPPSPYYYADHRGATVQCHEPFTGVTENCPANHFMQAITTNILAGTVTATCFNPIDGTTQIVELN